MKNFVLSFCLVFVSVSARAGTEDNVAKELARGAQILANKRVAVMTMPYHDGKVSSGSSIFAERLTTSLVARKGIQVIERRLLKQLLEEKKLSETGAISPSQVKKLGQLLDVEAIVTGTLIDFDDNWTEVNARMIRVETGEVIAVSQQMFQRTWSDKPVEPARLARPAAPMKPKLALENESETANRLARREHAAPGKALRLSNMSLPPGRRFYKGPPPQLGNKDRKKQEAAGDGSYQEEGPADRPRSKVGTQMADDFEVFDAPKGRLPGER